MKQRLIGIALLVGCAILGAIAFLVYAGQDRVVPEIQVRDREIIYTEGDNYSELLEGVTAEDNRDGDLTDQIFVDRIVTMGDRRATVYYGVMDQAHNVGRASREIIYLQGDEAVEGEDAAVP